MIRSLSLSHLTPIAENKSIDAENVTNSDKNMVLGRSMSLPVSGKINIRVKGKERIKEMRSKDDKSIDLSAAHRVNCIVEMHKRRLSEFKAMGLQVVTEDLSDSSNSTEELEHCQ